MKNIAPDSLAALAVSVAIVFDIHLDGPISEVRVARVDGDFIINPSPAQIESADIDPHIGVIDSVARRRNE